MRYDIGADDFIAVFEQLENRCRSSQPGSARDAHPSCHRLPPIRLIRAESARGGSIFVNQHKLLLGELRLVQRGQVLLELNDAGR